MKVRRPREKRKEMERVRELHGLRGPATLITASYTFSKDFLFKGFQLFKMLPPYLILSSLSKTAKPLIL